MSSNDPTGPLDSGASLPSWKDRLNKLFPAPVKSRGTKYFNDGRVTLRKHTPRELRAVVRGTFSYEVEVLWRQDKGGGNGEIDILCDCLHFHNGYACKHIWAVVLAGDQALAARAETKSGSTHWKTLLFPEKEGKESVLNRWEGVPGEFMLRYLLEREGEGMYVTAIKQKVLLNGKPGKQAWAATHEILEENDLPEDDRRILEGLLIRSRKGQFRGYNWYRPLGEGRFEACGVRGQVLGRLLPLLAGTKRCQVLDRHRMLADPLEVGEPFAASLEFELDDEFPEVEQGNLVYVPRVRLGHEQLHFAEIPMIFDTSPLTFVFRGRLHELPGPDHAWLERMEEARNRVLVPEEQARELYIAVNDPASPGTGPAIALPKGVAPKTLPVAEPRPCLEIDVLEQSIEAQLWLDYDGAEIRSDDPRPAILDVDNWSRTMRHEHAEKSLHLQLERMGLMRGEARYTLPWDTVWESLEGLAPLVKEGWIIRGRDKRRLAKGVVSDLRVTSGVDWFEVKGGMDFGNAIVPLPQAIRAYMRGEKTIELPDGSRGVLPETWLRRHSDILAMGEGKAKSGNLRYRATQAMALDKLLDELGEAACDRNFSELRARMSSFSSITPPTPPDGFHGELRPYQREALGWLDFLASFGFGGVLADDMGLGKTVQVLAWLQLEKERGTGGPTLVVAPTSLLFNWREEAARFCPGLRVLSYFGVDRSGAESHFQEHDLVLTTYGLLRRDVDILHRVRWRCLILDESQAIKNPDSQTAKAARTLEADRRLCMTGTPLENRLDELWSQLHFCNRNMLGSRTAFDWRFGKPVAQGVESARVLLQRIIRPFLLRRTKEAVARDLPGKQESVIRCEMPRAQAEVYARLREHYRSEILSSVDTQGLDHSRMKVIEGLLRLRQAACHPSLVGDDSDASGKLEELVSMITSVVEKGHKALVFSQFTRFLALVRRRLEQAGIPHEYLDGRTPAATREKRVAAFQDATGAPVFCISLKAGGVGLNLTAADYVFILDPWWNPAVESQAVDRTHRIGQNKRVFAYRLISADSIDEKVLELQREKLELAEILQQGATSAIGSLTRDDLVMLFS